MLQTVADLDPSATLASLEETARRRRAAAADGAAALPGSSPT